MADVPVVAPDPNVLLVFTSPAFPAYSELYNPKVTAPVKSAIDLLTSHEMNEFDSSCAEHLTNGWK